MKLTDNHEHVKVTFNIINTLQENQICYILP